MSEHFQHWTNGRFIPRCLVGTTTTWPAWDMTSDPAEVTCRKCLRRMRTDGGPAGRVSFAALAG